MEKRRRNVVREPEFEEQLASLIPNIADADDFTHGAEIILSIDPEAGMEAEESVWILPMFPVQNREVYLYYTFDAQTVYFLWILTT